MCSFLKELHQKFCARNNIIQSLIPNILVLNIPDFIRNRFDAQE